MLHMTTIFIYIDPINSRHSCKYTYSMTIRRILGYGPGFISTYPYFIFDRSQHLTTVRFCSAPKIFILPPATFFFLQTFATKIRWRHQTTFICRFRGPASPQEKNQLCQFARRNWGGEFAVAERLREVNLNKVTIYKLIEKAG